MQPNDPDANQAAIDLGPLAWVLDELRKSLDAASAALRRYVRDTAAARGTDLESVDDAPLRLARQQLHQAVGALEMVGLPLPAQVLRAMEAAVQKFSEKPELCSEAAAAKIERAGFALTQYLGGVLQGKQVPAIALFPQYREAQELAGADRIHPADLWAFDFRWNEPQMAAAPESEAYGAAVRARMDQAVLRLVRSGEAAAGRSMAGLCLALAAGQAQSHPRIFWKISAAYFEALGLGLLPLDIYVKRAASRVLMQYAALAKGESAISDRLAQDLLFFCAQAVPARAADAPILASVRSAWGLSAATPVDYQTPQFGRFDPVLLAQARKRIGAAKEAWSAAAGGDVNKLRGAVDQFQLVGESMLKLHPQSAPLARALNAAVEAVARAGKAPGPEMGMEVATAVLYLEAGFDEFGPADVQIEARTSRLAERLDQVREGGKSQPLEAWIEELYGRVSDRQTMGSVVGELRTTLGELEKLLDIFFRNSRDKAPLQGAPAHLSQMRGVLSVLGLEQAAQAVLRMRETVEDILVTEVDEAQARAAGTFDKLGNNLGALGFLIDMLNYQPGLAKKLFVYDDALGELMPLMGRGAAPDAPPADLPAPEATLSEEALSVLTNAQDGGAADALSARLDTLAMQAILADQIALARTAREASAAVAGTDAGAATAALNTLAEAVQAVAPVAPPVSTPEAECEEDDLRDIFLEEAREVVQTGLAALEVLAQQPGDLAELTTLRRAFHTLKGSSRMVGLNEFGDAGWSMEQVLNTWLADQKSANDDLRHLCGDALRAFGRWAEDIATGQDGAWKASVFREPADALRTEHRLLPLVLPGVAAAPAAAAQEAGADDLPLQGLLEPEAHQVRSQTLPVARAGDPFATHGDELADTDPVELHELPEPPARDVATHGAIDPAPSIAAAPDQDRALAQPGEEIDVQAFADLAAFQEAGPVDAVEVIAPVNGFEAIDLPALPEPPAAEWVVQEAGPAGAPAHPVEAPGAADEALLERLQKAQTWPAPLQDVPLPRHGLEEAEATALEAESHDDQVKVIGSLRIGLPLYNVYLNEADEWSRRLVTEVNEWSLELNQRLPDSTVGLAHALGGSSATVGFHALSAIARALEAALSHAQDLACGTPQHAETFTDAAEEIRRLLHQFAAGFLKEPDPRILPALQALAQLGGWQRGEPPELQESTGSVEVLDAPAWAHGPADEHFLEQPSEPLQVPAGSSTPVHADPLPAAEAMPLLPETTTAATQATVRSFSSDTQGTFFGAGVDDDLDQLDVVDALDLDLFPIFEEEAAELMPQLGGALRQWVARPENHSAREEVLRALHTLKGSARLAGALRMGELAHRLESEIEHLGSGVANAPDLEPLLHRFDGIQGNFEWLRNNIGKAASPSLEALAEAEAASVVLAAAALAQSSPAVDASAAQEGKAAPAGAPRALARPAVMLVAPQRAAANHAVRVRSQLLDRLVNQTGEVMITRSRLEAELGQLRVSLAELTGNLDRLRSQLRDIELQAESQMQSRLAQAKDSASGFDPLEFDRFTRVQELTRMMAESVNDVATVQRNLQRTVQATEDDLIAQARQTRELQRDLLRTRMVEFEGIADRLYRVVRMASKETGKQVRLDISGGSIEMDRGVLDRMTPAFEHLLRNCVAHGIEEPGQRTRAGKESTGTIGIVLSHEGNDVSVEFRDDGAGLDLERIRAKARELGLVPAGQAISDAEAGNLIFMPGFSTATQITELSGRGIGMDVVRAEVNALGGRIETSTRTGQGTSFKLVLPLTTAVTQVVMVRSGNLSIGVPANVVEIVIRAPQAAVQQAYASGFYDVGGEQVPFYWSGALLQASQRSAEAPAKTQTVVVFRSAAQRVAVHVDQVLGNQEAVVKNLGPQLARLPGLAGMSVLASGAVVLIYNPVALTAVYGEQARKLGVEQARLGPEAQAARERTMLAAAAVPQTPLVLVVDDSITVRRVTQRLLQREGYRVAMAADGLQALARLAEERPALVLSDIEMPRMDGFDLARNIRADEKLAGLPIIMITSRIAAKHREHAMALGVNHYLGKPYSEEELLSLIRHHCTAAALA